MDEAEIAQELDLSRQLIEKQTSTKAQHFTYPWGWWSEAADAVVREHYETASVGGGPPIVAGTDPTRVSRIPIQASDSARVFERRCTYGLRLERYARSFVDRYLR